MKFTLSDILLTILFTCGGVVLAFALVEEARTGAAFYIILTSVSGALMIGATFIATIRK